MAEKEMKEVVIKQTTDIGGKVFFPGKVTVDAATAAAVEDDQKRQVRSAQTQAGSAEGGDEIPEDFPHAKILADNDVTTFTQLAELDHQGLTELKGIGDAKATEILNAAEEF